MAKDWILKITVILEPRIKESGEEMLNPIGLSMHELERIITSQPAAANQGIYLAHDLNSNHYFVLDRLNKSGQSQQPFEFETFDQAYSFCKNKGANADG